jgi:hypothetical protein
MIITIELEGMLFTFHIHNLTITAEPIEDEAEEFDLDEFEIVEDENGDLWIYDEEAEVWYFYDEEEDSWLLDEFEDSEDEDEDSEE